MMHLGSALLLFALHVKYLAADSMGNNEEFWESPELQAAITSDTIDQMQNSTDKSAVKFMNIMPKTMDGLVDIMVDKILNRALNETSVSNTSLDQSMVTKPGYLAIPSLPGEQNSPASKSSYIAAKCCAEFGEQFAQTSPAAARKLCNPVNTEVRPHDPHPPQRGGNAFSPLCFGALLMETEQRELFEHEMVILNGLEGAAGTGNHSIEMVFRQATKHIAAIKLSKTNEMQLPQKDSALYYSNKGPIPFLPGTVIR
eukprot:gnl/MRDRNA2_/MRDRNA2_151937_c0_seq1.p1 gnl/MRDRNA2_/MRDRNA2_151937_c0~~gnl/MRDRNA2_/MRDRNA2_151937_c0_seq1.p1  ORF type:complete len:256 (+),score=46.72 gnl/MRDRNA2_/MRDRNA2_151937_c0_seq1:141-908(+)